MTAKLTKKERQMSYEKIESMKLRFQTNKDESMRLKYIGDAVSSYIKTVADTENAFTSISLQLFKNEVTMFREELEKNKTMALDNVRQALSYANDLAQKHDLDLVFAGDLTSKEQLKEYAHTLFMAYYQRGLSS